MTNATTLAAAEAAVVAANAEVDRLRAKLADEQAATSTAQDAEETKSDDWAVTAADGIAAARLRFPQ
jgi:hypothetical protein